MDRLVALNGKPEMIRVDNGPEMVGRAVSSWCEEHHVQLRPIERGKPMQNGFIERFNRSYREAVLNMYIFETLEEVRTETEKWLGVYNQQRPHESLGNLTPMEYLQKFNPQTVI